MDPPPNARLLVIVDRPIAVYSGMVPGRVAGDYAAHELEIDVVPLARRAGAGVILAPATDIDPVRHELFIKGRPPLRFDIASLDVGSTVRGLDVPGVQEHALSTRPIGRFVEAIDARLERLCQLDRPARVAIVGAGAAGTEIAFTLDARLRASGVSPAIQLFTSDDQLLSGGAKAAQQALAREAERRGIRCEFGVRVVRVKKDGLVTESANKASRDSVTNAHEADLVVWATGAAPVAFPAQRCTSRLTVDDTGFLEIRDTLQTVGFDDVFAVGDCARLVNHRWVPRAGVYAVREGPYLDRNLRAALQGEHLHSYRPQRDFLSLLNLGEKRALGTKWGRPFSGKAVYQLKDWIDRRFMQRFQVLDRDGRPHAALVSLGAMGDSDDADMMCGGCAAKLGAEPLSAALAALPSSPTDDSVLLGLDARDDVAATRDPDGGTTLHNLDVIRAFCDDPFLVGQVAASNALSDLHAKGGRPRHAQAFIALPELPPGESQELLFQTLSGLRSILDALEVSLLGGHTTIGGELTVGLSVSGEGPPEAELLRQTGARPGDALLLTQPLGTGVVLAADMQGLARGAWIATAHAAMQHTNDVGGQIARNGAAHAATDVTGFGFAGHLLTMLEREDLVAEIERSALPLLPGAHTLWESGLRSTAHPANREAFRGKVRAARAEDEAWLFDPQTAGGLLLAVPEAEADSVLKTFEQAGEPKVTRIGRIATSVHPGGAIDVFD